MKIYKISQNKVTGYDTYSEAVVCAESKEEARKIHPNGNNNWDLNNDYGWSDSKDVLVKFIGIAEDDIKKGVICASFHAG